MAVRHRRLLDRLPRLRRPQAARRPRRGSPVFGGVPKPASEKHLPHRLATAATARSSPRRRSTTSGSPARRSARRCGCASWIVLGPIVSVPAPVWITVSGRIRPASSAAAIVNGFIVEPGSNTSVSARLRICSRATLLRRSGCTSASWRAPGSRRSATSRITRPPAFALLQLDRGLELAEREVLQPRVDREREVAAGLRRADRRDVLDRVAAAVDDHAAAARPAAEPLLLRELDALLAGVVVAGEAEDVARSSRRPDRSAGTRSGRGGP